jgi:hypothetical protein
MRRKWTHLTVTEENKIRRLSAVATPSEIARLLGTSFPTIRRAQRRMGLVPSKACPATRPPDDGLTVLQDLVNEHPEVPDEILVKVIVETMLLRPGSPWNNQTIFNYKDSPLHVAALTENVAATVATLRLRQLRVN